MDALDADDVLSVEVHDGVVGALVRESRGLIMLKGAGLRFALVGERFYKLAHEAGQIALGIGSVLAPDDMIRDERKVIAYSRQMEPKPILRHLSLHRS